MHPNTNHSPNSGPGVMIFPPGVYCRYITCILIQTNSPNSGPGVMTIPPGVYCRYITCILIQTNSPNSGPGVTTFPPGVYCRYITCILIQTNSPNSLHEDSSLTKPSRSPSDPLITCRDLQFLRKYPKGLRRRCHYRNLVPDVFGTLGLETVKLNVSRYKITRDESVTSWRYE